MLKISLRKKIYLQFILFIVVSGLLWFASYYIDYLLKQKIQIIDKKSHLLNIILEARRYEKNFFLSGNPADLKQAIAYITEAKEKFRKIAEEHGQYTLTRNFEAHLADFDEYEKDLIHLAEKWENEDERVLPVLIAQKEEISALGHKITENMDKIVREEREHVHQLLGHSQLGLIGTMFTLGFLGVLTIIFFFVNVNTPLLAIENAIHKIAQGDYASIPEINRGDEFESLVSSLNDMLQKLHRRSEHLVQIEKLASLGTLTSGVAHELNNPLNNISTSIQIVLEELEEPEIEFKQELLTEAEKQVERARDIIRGLLEFSRQSAFSKKQIRLNQLVTKTVRLIKSEVPDNIRIRMDVPEDICAELDPQRFQQVLINLLINAIHAMELGGEILIQAWHDPEHDGFFIRIQDQGTGIEKEQLSHIFDPFFTTKEVGKGSGLGLSISHGIIEQHGGNIKVETTLGSGTSFTLFLPNESLNNGNTEESNHSDR